MTQTETAAVPAVTVKQFDKDICDRMCDDMAELFKEFERTWGVKVAVLGGKYEHTVFRPKLRIHLKAQDGGMNYAKEAATWQAHAVNLGLAIGWLNRIVHIKGQAYKIMGLKLSRKKKPVCLRREYDKKTFFAPVELVKQAMRPQ